MRLAITCQEDNLESTIDQRFGRCKYFLIVDIEDNKISKTNFVLNQGAEQGHGAGTKASEQIGELKVDAVITGQLGPNATLVLKQLKISSYHATGTAEKAIQLFLEGKLNVISEEAEPHSNIPDNKPEIIVKEKGKILDSKVIKENRVFIPLLNNNGLDSNVSEHFGHAPFFAIYNTSSKKLEIKENNLNHSDMNKTPVDQVIELANPTIVFTLGIGTRAIQLFNEKGIELKTGNCSTVKDVIKDLDSLDEQNESCGHEEH